MLSISFCSKRVKSENRKSLMSSKILILILVAGNLSATCAFGIARNVNINTCRTLKNGKGINIALRVSSHHAGTSAAVDEDDEDEGESDITLSLLQELQEKDFELAEMRAELDSMSSLLQQQEHQGRQFNEYYPLFCEQMAAKGDEIQELKKVIEEYEIKLQERGDENDSEELQGSQTGGTEQVTTASITKDSSEVEQLKEKIQDYQMQLAFSSHDLASKESKIEKLTQEVSDLTAEMMTMDEQFTKEYQQLEDKMELEMKKTSEEINHLRKLLHELESEKVVRKGAEWNGDFDVSDTQLKPTVTRSSRRSQHFLERTIDNKPQNGAQIMKKTPTGAQVLSAPHDVIKWE